MYGLKKNRVLLCNKSDVLSKKKGPLNKLLQHHRFFFLERFKAYSNV